MPTLVLASRNRNKAVEITKLLQPYDIHVRSVLEFPEVPEVIESGSTFAENAAKKATETAQSLGQWTLADDSGLMVDALDGAPGVHSARYAGDDATDEQNNEKLLQALAEVPDEARAARFVCCLAVADPAGDTRLSVSGHCCGLIVREDRGSQGFGYDPLFLIREYGKTFGELSLAVKSQLSHRARALRQLVPELVSLLG